MRKNPTNNRFPAIEGDYLYHVTHRSNLASIAEHGLVPKVPEDYAGADTKAVYTFPTYRDMEIALLNWMGERIDDLIEEGTYTDDWVCLGIMLEGINWDDAVSDVDFEIAILHTVDPQYIRVLDIPI